jgi:hypothetical protein
MEQGSGKEKQSGDKQANPGDSNYDGDWANDGVAPDVGRILIRGQLFP